MLLIKVRKKIQTGTHKWIPNLNFIPILCIITPQMYRHPQSLKPHTDMHTGI